MQELIVSVNKAICFKLQFTLTDVELKEFDDGLTELINVELERNDNSETNLATMLNKLLLAIRKERQNYKS